MIRIIKLVIWIGVISSGIFFWKYSQFSDTVLTEQETTIKIESGGFQNALINAGASSFFTKIYLSQNPPEFTLQKGSYTIPANANIETYIQSLKNPLNETDIQITLLEGWNIYDIDLELQNLGLISGGEYIQYTTSCDLFCELKKDFAFISDAETLEGFLYPDTYNINPNNFQVQTLVRSQLQNFQRKVIDSEIITNMGSIEILDILNMASIVQKETSFHRTINGQRTRKTPEDIFQEASNIAGVLQKRLSEGWQIGADATICYPYKIPTQNCTPKEVLQYLYEKNQYNTRQMTGLPKTPISNPEALIIQATINSQSSPYYYYLHDPSGQIHYGITEADHNRNKNTYLN